MKTRTHYSAGPLSAKLLLSSWFVWVFKIAALAQLPTQYTSFKPGAVWLANDGLPIDCHGGNIVYMDSLKTFYWYGEHRGEPQGASCYSSKDLYNWKNEGVVLKKDTIEKLERSKVIYDATRHRYVMWFHYDGNYHKIGEPGYKIAELGIAVSDKPTGPFVVKQHYRPNGHESRDIGMYLDPDTKKAYIGYAADHTNRTIRMVELSDDYLSTTTNDTDIEAHCEGPGILKKNGVYYLLTSGCSGWTPNPATYYTSATIMGPYTSHGSPFVGNAGNNSFNSQPCYIFKIPGYKNAYLYMGDRWNGGGHPDSQFVFLPITITPDGRMELHRYDEWNLNLFTPETKKSR